jgi:hypothetical protein
MFSKVFEKVMYKDVMYLLNCSSVLVNELYGFRKNLQVILHIKYLRPQVANFFLQEYCVVARVFDCAIGYYSQNCHIFGWMGVQTN